MITKKKIRHFHLFCGLGGGARGFNRGKARVGNMEAEFECIGGIDVDPAAIRDFERLSGVKGTVLDLFDREQYTAFHGHEPPADWHEATPEDIRRAAGGQRPNIVFLSAPCKGFSGLLSETKSKTDKYQQLNRCTLRGMWLNFEAWRDDPAEFILFENVPRIRTRGRHLVDQILEMGRSFGYAAAETVHDCGELGGLAQTRKRCLIVMRHIEKVPPFLYEPEKKTLRGVGEILERMPLPGAAIGGPMHRIPALKWKTWVRLAFVRPGTDWRSLNELVVENGHLKDFLIVPSMHSGGLGVNNWSDTLGTITSRGLPNNGNFAVADPRKQLYSAGYGMLDWQQPSGAVAGESLPSNGTFAVADPRHKGAPKHNNCFRIVEWRGPANAVTSADGSGQAVADPRPDYEGDYKQVKYRVTEFDESAGTVIAGSTTGNGAFAVADPRPPARPLFSKYPVTAFGDRAGTVIGGDDAGAYAVADPRPNIQRGKGDNYLTAGQYGVVGWQETAGAVSANGQHDNGRWSVADPRDMPALNENLVCRIIARDGTWHRPFTTLELAALQSLIDPDEYWAPAKDPALRARIDMLENRFTGREFFILDGKSDQAHRERIGNAVPPEAAEAIAGVIGTTLLLAWTGETFSLGSTPIWVREVAIALSVKGI